MSKFNIAGDVGVINENTTIIGDQTVNMREQDYSVLAAEIRELLDGLQNKNTSLAECIEIVGRTIKGNSALQQKLLNAVKAGGHEALKVIFNHPAYSISAETIKGFLKAK